MNRLPVLAICCLIVALIVAPACNQSGEGQTGKSYSSAPTATAAPGSSSSPTIQIPASSPQPTPPHLNVGPTWVLNHDVYSKDNNLAEFNTHAQAVATVIGGAYSADGTFREDQARKALELYFVTTDAKKYAKKN